MKKIKYIPIIITVFLFGCASDGSKFRSSFKEKDQTISATFLGKPKIEYMSDKLGGSFGLVGALLEMAATSDKRDSQNAVIAKALERIDVKREFVSTLTERTARCGIRITSDVAYFEEKTSDWWKSESPAPQTNAISGGNPIVFELALGTIFVQSPAGADTLGIDARVKIFDRTTSKMIDKILESNLFDDRKVVLAHFSEGDPKRDDEIVDATKRSLVILSEGLAKKMCGT